MVAQGDSESGMTKSWILPVISFVVLAVPMVWIIQFERLALHDQTVLLPLTVVKLISIMLGDYMALRYPLAGDLLRMNAPEQGRLVVRLNDRQIADFVRLEDGSALAQDELLINYHQRQGR